MTPLAPWVKVNTRALLMQAAAIPLLALASLYGLAALGVAALEKGSIETGAGPVVALVSMLGAVSLSAMAGWAYLLRLLLRLEIAETALNSGRDGYWILDRNGRFIEVNQNYCRMLGYTRAEILAKNIADFEAVASAEQVGAQIKRILASGTESFETRHQHRDGDWIDLEITATRIAERYLVVFLRNVSGRKLTEARAHHLAFFDDLTALPNRRLMQDRIEQALLSSLRTGKHGALVFLDLDNFKLINDSLGHAAGDDLLVQSAQALRACVRLGDTVARQGGDELVLVLERLSQDPGLAAQQAGAIAEKCRLALAKAFLVADTEVFVTASFGVALFCGERVAVDTLLQRADSAMYQAKSLGRNRVVFFSADVEQRMAGRARFEAELSRALSAGQLRLHLLPLVDLSGQLLGAEMLLRWQHPQRGLLKPEDFMRVAEETGLIGPIGAWVLEAACQQLVRWAGEPGRANLRLSVNISLVQFLQEGFLSELVGLLAANPFQPSRLALEFSEKMLNNDPGAVAHKMAQVADLGVCIAMDNFGAGLSPLTHLRRLPLRQVKIDRSLIQSLSDSAADLVLVSTIISLATRLGLEVVAEGVETQVSREILQNNGCSTYQGFLFSQALPAEEFEANLLHRWACA